MTKTVLDSEIPETNMVLVPKPFTFEGLINPESTKVYLPGQVIEHGQYSCACVHMCDQFATYPLIEWGIRCIPTYTRCKFGGTCHGSRVFVNGTMTNQNTFLKCDMIAGLHKPSKTR